MSAFESGSFEDATWPVGDPVVIPTEFYPSDFTCRPEPGTSRVPGTDDFVELGQPQIRAVDKRLLEVADTVSADNLEWDGWKRFSDLSEKMQFTDGLDETLLSRLFVTAEHVQPIIQRTVRDNRRPLSRNSWQRKMFDEVMLTTDWLEEVIYNPLVEPEVSNVLVDFVGNMKPAKKMEINIVRLASAIWYAKMSDDEFAKAAQASPAVFSKLLSDEVLTGSARIEQARRPDVAFDTKRRVVQQLSPYAFAGMPMRPRQVDVVASLCHE